MPSTEPGLIFRTLRRRRWPIFTRWALLTVALISTAYVLLVGPYRAVSILRVDPVSTGLSNVKQGGAALDSFLQTQIQLITSPNILIDAATHPKTAILPRIKAAPDVVQELRQSLRVSVIPGTYLIEVSATSASAAESATVVNAVIDSYQAKAPPGIRPVNSAGAMVPGRRTTLWYRPWVLLAIPFATFAFVLSLYSGVEAWSTSKRQAVTVEG